MKRHPDIRKRQGLAPSLLGLSLGFPSAPVDWVGRQAPVVFDWWVRLLTWLTIEPAGTLASALGVSPAVVWLLLPFSALGVVITARALYQLAAGDRKRTQIVSVQRPTRCLP
jgi:hypothetical protein